MIFFRAFSTAEPGECLGAQHHVAAVEQAEILFVLEGSGEIEEIKRFGEVLQRVVKISGFFRIIQDNEVVAVLGEFVFENGRYQELAGASVQVFTEDALGVPA